MDLDRALDIGTGNRDRRTAELARRYVHALAGLDGTIAGDLLAHVADVDLALHDLVAEVTGACPWCDLGTCPRAILDTPPL